MATAYGQSLGLDTTMLLIALLVTQIVAFPSAILLGKLSRSVRIEIIIGICIAAYLGISVYAIFLNEIYEFWILAVCVGLFQGTIQALSRSYYAKIIPLEKSGEYFGVYDIFGKGAAFTGTHGHAPRLDSHTGDGQPELRRRLACGNVRAWHSVLYPRRALQGQDGGGTLLRRFALGRARRDSRGKRRRQRRMTPEMMLYFFKKAVQNANCFF